MSPADIPRNRIITGDALATLRSLPAGSIDCVVTSPPYFRLRDYGHRGQIGLETHVDDWVGQLRQVLGECGRVLVPTGTVWLNLGDSYSTHVREGAARKSQLLGPDRLALALLADGWLIRNKIIWAKPNTVPSSVTDRLSTTHEVIYLLARASRYFFDLDAIRQPHKSQRSTTRSIVRGRQAVAERPDWLGPNSDGDSGLRAMRAAGSVGHPLGKNPGDVWQDAVSRYRGAHFATYPLSLASRMVRAGTPERRCRTCRAPYRRPVHRLGAVATRLALQADCSCRPTSEPGLVLDPFIGAATTALAAEQHGRDWLGVEINPHFVDLANERLAAARHDSSALGEAA